LAHQPDIICFEMALQHRGYVVVDLLSVEEALARVLAHFTSLPSEEIALSSALGRVLARFITAPADIPPFDNSAVDGFAVSAADTATSSDSAPTRLPVVMDIPAGATPSRPLRPGEAARIMTGAPMPEGANAAVMVEHTLTAWQPTDNALDSVLIVRPVKAGDNVRQRGEDVRAGQTVLEAGTRLRAAEIGLLASVGCARPAVVRQPRVAILSTGDELVEVGDPLAPGKIHDSNRYALAALVATYGGIPLLIPTARDTLDDVRLRFRQALEQQPDLILSSAGVSVGAYDVVRTVIEEMGAVDFWRINMRPGKPLAFGRIGGVPFFGLPGNPVSAMVTFEVFVRPALLRLAHLPDPNRTVQAELADDLTSDGRRSYLRVRLTRQENRWRAHLTGNQSSGVLTSMVKADGLLIVPENITQVQAGTILPVRLLKDLPE
jgi:molybdopterin molybdotransferase